MCLSFETGEDAAVKMGNFREVLRMISSTGTDGIGNLERDTERVNLGLALGESFSSERECLEEIEVRARRALESMLELRDALRAYRGRLEDALLGRGQMPIYSAEDADNG